MSWTTAMFMAVEESQAQYSFKHRHWTWFFKMLRILSSHRIHLEGGRCIFCEMKSDKYILLSNSSDSLLSRQIFIIVCFSLIFLCVILKSFTVLNKLWALSAKQTNQPFHGKQKSNYRGPALLYLCKVHQSLRQRSAGDRGAACSSWSSSEEPEWQHLPPPCRSLQHHWGIVKPCKLPKWRRKGIIISLYINLWHKLVFPMLKYCAVSLMESKLKFRSCIQSVMRNRTTQHRRHCTLQWSSVPAEDLWGINVQF